MRTEKKPYIEKPFPIFFREFFQFINPDNTVEKCSANDQSHNAYSEGIGWNLFDKYWSNSKKENCD